MAVSDREFATLAAEVKYLKDSVNDVRSEVRVIDGKVDGLLSRFDRIDGGMKVAMGVSGFLGAAAMLLMTKVVPFLFAGLPRI
jgi:hypothetical protein